MRHRNHPNVSLVHGRIGLISDTHGLVRPAALRALKNSELIIHAGDIGTPDVLTALEQIAPVLSIKGNNDHGPWARKLPDVLSVVVNTNVTRVIHNVHELEFERNRAGIKIVISGHSHKPGIVSRDGILFINPGSAGPRRFNLPVTVGRLKVTNTNLLAIIVELPV